MIKKVVQRGNCFYFTTERGNVENSIWNYDLENVSSTTNQNFEPKIEVEVHLSVAVFSSKRRAVILINDDQKELNLPTIVWNDPETSWIDLAMEEFGSKVVLSLKNRIAMWLHHKFALSKDCVEDFIKHHGYRRAVFRLSLQSVSPKRSDVFLIYLNGNYQGVGFIDYQEIEKSKGKFDIIFLHFIEDKIDIEDQVQFLDGEKLEDGYLNREIRMFTVEELAMANSILLPKVQLVWNFMKNLQLEEKKGK